MPTTDNELNHRTKQQLLAMVETANAMLLNINRIDTLKESSKLTAGTHAQNLASVISNIKTHIEQQNNHKTDGLAIIKDMITDLEASVIDMGLTYNQEQHLITFLNTNIEKTIVRLEDEIDMDIQLFTMLEKVDECLK